MGICHAAAILVGKAVGRGETEEAYQTAKRFLIATPLMGLVLGGILILVRNPLLSLFAIETEGSRATASALLLFYGCWLALRSSFLQSCCHNGTAKNAVATGDTIRIPYVT